MANVSTECQPSRPDLVDVWIKAYGGPPPKGLSTRLLVYACHYNGQVKEYGGLKKSTLRQLGRYVPASPGTTTTDTRPPVALKPSTGSRLVREWRGKTHMVDIEENGFVYQGKSYRSLSAVARTITGARWSGPRFFGV
ncbi:DUF2924 domain-containing protein [uncultured Sneathiella sp.]|uniref:DUF2924 domain-containing protein n=1 Tax=uncultured Sneathiella sp. TaxID=879315 RepID=UPI0025964625|nr:DUF2924 domain-containing protein [uncultured Sneathiella sp.]